MLGIAVLAEDVELVRLLLNAGADPSANRPPREPMLLSATDRPDILRLLLENGAQVLTRDEDGRTALHYAAMSDEPEAVDLLLRHGTPAGIVDDRGRTPGDLAEEAGHTDLAARLRADRGR